MRSRWLGIAAALAAAIASVALWNRLPPQLVTHWSLHGVADGSSIHFVPEPLIP